MRNKQKEEDSQIVVGLDIGTTKIATVVGAKNGENIDILGYGLAESTGVQHGLIVNIVDTVKGIVRSTDMARERSGYDIQNVFAGIAGRHVRSKSFVHSFLRDDDKEKPIQQIEIDRVVEQLEKISVEPGEKIIQVIPQRFIVDNKRETVNPVGEWGEFLQGYFQIMTSNEMEIRKIVSCVNESGLSVVDITLEPIASSLSCLSEEEKKRGVALIDIGGGTSDVAIYYKGSLVFTKVIPIGGNIITQDIAKICKITDEMAEQLKISYGHCLEEKCIPNNMITIPQFLGQDARSISETNLAKIINARVKKDIIEAVKMAIKDSGFANELYAGVVFTGGGSLLRDIRELAQFVIQKNIRMVSPMQGFHNQSGTLKSPIFSTALGLLKYGINATTIKMNENAEQSGGRRRRNSEKGEIIGRDGGKPGMGIFAPVASYFKNILNKIAEEEIS